MLGLLVLLTNCSAQSINGLLWNKSGVLPSYIFVRSFLHQQIADTVMVSADGTFVLHNSDTVTHQKRLFVFNQAVEFICNPAEKNVRLLVELDDKSIVKFDVIGSLEQLAFDKLNQANKSFDLQLAMAMVSEAGDSAFRIALEEYGRRLFAVEKEYPHTFTTLKLIPLRKNIQAKTISGYADSLINRIRLFPAVLNTTAYLSQQVRFLMLNVLNAKKENSVYWIEKWLNDIKEDKAYQKFIAELLYQNFLNSGMQDEMQELIKYFMHTDSTILSAPTKQQLIRLEKEMPGNKLKTILVTDSKSNLVQVDSVMNAQQSKSILVFWDLDCSNCNNTLAILQKESEIISKSKVNVYTIALNDDPVRWMEQTQTFPENWKSYIGSTQQLHNWQISVTPTLILTDESGKIISRMENINQMLKRLYHQ